MADTLLRLSLVAVGGGLGSIARYALSGAAQVVMGTRFPVGVLVVNVLGCFVIGVLAHMMVERPTAIAPHVRALVMYGFLGGLTTFSSLGYDTVMLASTGDRGLALINVLANAGLSVGAAFAGLVCGRIVLR